jgi:predicted ATP-dependent endonuclease of OLD family
MLSSISIKGFKSPFSDFNLNDLKNINYLVGKNGCGKSSILEALWLFSLKADLVYAGPEKRCDVFQEHYRIVQEGKTINLNSTDDTSYQDRSTLEISDKVLFIDIEKISSLRVANKSKLSREYINIFGNIVDGKRILFDAACNEILSRYPKGEEIVRRKMDYTISDKENQNSILEKYLDPKYSFKNYNKVNISELTHLLKDQYHESSCQPGWQEIKEFWRSENAISTTPNANDFSTSQQASGNSLVLSLPLIFALLVENPKYEYILIEEPEVGLHPELQKLLPRLFQKMVELSKIHLKKDIQFFISTHSPILVRHALDIHNQKIYHIKGSQNIKGDIKINSVSLQDIKSNNFVNFDSIIKDLGFEMTDLYYANKLIYVEGPTDILYIQYWLNKYVEESSLIPIIKGFDYEFVEYGGSLAAHLSFNGATPDTKLVDVLKINRNIFFITDNDSGKSSFRPSKDRIKKEISEIKSCKYYEEPNQDIKTIEDYLTDESKFSKVKDKTIKAMQNVKYWEEKNLNLKSFRPEVQDLCKTIYNFITQPT